MKTVWYHGGPKLTYLDAIKWDRERGIRDQNAAGPGLYWTLDPREASGYGEHLYRATTKRGFRFMPAGRPSMLCVGRLFDLAPRHRQEQFLENWPDHSLADALANYTREQTMLDAAVVLYHDLFQYNAAEYVEAMRQIYDGARVIGSGGQHGRAGSRGRHLVVWAPDKMIIEAV